jgi:4-hydroxy-tetrahydrodipicolinate reductase
VTFYGIIRSGKKIGLGEAIMKIGIVGCMGRMGQMLVSAVLAESRADLSGGTERVGSPTLGQDLGKSLGQVTGLTVGSDPEALFAVSDAIIDFTSPAATRVHAELAAKTNTALIVGTTGLSQDDETVLMQAGLSVPIVYAPNFSVGVTLLTALVEMAAAALDNSYDIEIVEMHHRHKVDAPSGTALGLGKAAAKGRHIALDKVWQKSRDGHTGPRRRGEIGFATLRGGDVVGDHTVIYAGDGERIEITHKASNRSVFASGAVRAALWTQDRTSGLYSMTDVLGL